MTDIAGIAARIADRLKQEACECEWAHGPTPICISENFNSDKATEVLAEELKTLLEVK